MGLEIGVFLTYVGAILLIFVFGKIFAWPLKLMLKLAVSSLVGGAAILLINAVGAGFDLLIPLNAVNAVIVGVLGLPGAVMLLIVTAAW